ncbi:hypothetical protein Tsubulata_021254 [Turnera subulata]|uniref:Protein kinase domain-containing protein n=1 Tax=Turnera subulata TaxID=218843 RepID=A0A9Q0FBP2_9ROSI|nr:hypothetical protein Tsubulata_021254 [Turnera subulata]
MCNKRIEILNSEQQHPQETPFFMDNPMSATNSNPGSNHTSNGEMPRVKLLCSFLGSIMPRPQDGKLRYVGGETRIVSLPRDISYEELMSKMRELYEGAALLKYQQPDEDLDALVSVVNDDDVTNMMEEYDKMDSGDGFSRLRIFLFSPQEQDGLVHYIDGDDRETERRYVDALNSLGDGTELRRQQSDSPLIGAIDDIYVQEQFFSPINVDGGLHGQRNGDIPIPQYNLRHVAIPQRYNEEGSWSPAYYSPSHHGPFSAHPNSPPSARFCVPFGELPDRGMDRVPEENCRSQLNHCPVYDHHPPYCENAVWMSGVPISSDKAGFPSNMLQGPSVFEGNSSCEHCRVGFQRNQLHLEQPTIGNGLPHVANPCAEYSSNREGFLVNGDVRSVYGETHERGWIPQHQPSPHAEEARMHTSGAGRFNDTYTGDGPGLSYPLGHSNLLDGHHTSTNYVPQRAGPESGNQGFHDQHVIAPHHLDASYAHGSENIYPIPHGQPQAHSLWKNVPNPMHGAPFQEASSTTPLMNGTVNQSFTGGTGGFRHKVSTGMDGQHNLVEPSQKMLGFDGTSLAGYPHPHGHVLKLNPNTSGLEKLQSLRPEPVQPSLPQEILTLSTVFCAPNVAEVATREERNEAGLGEKVENFDVPRLAVPGQNGTLDKKSGAVVVESVNPECIKDVEQHGDSVTKGGNDICAANEDPILSPSRLSFLPDLIASVKKAALEEAEDVKARVEENAEPVKTNSVLKQELETVNAQEEPELGSDSDHVDNNKIEMTKAEAEAMERGLQTIKNDDLEEIRELGSGTYGAVYHGKWKGSDVAIKRIKASCFAGRPSERERLIADFWKEALILSSLHHPNVVSFYGIVRDGPGGSLATVTEFMINGSLKQFLQKKDRTIDRRKRLIIAMDAAFGMEYLHGKNIVHFDLKCENLLVNMRDPQRPICKIGDLGLSKVKQQTLVSGGVRGTLPWMAPELLSGKNHMVTEKIDVYSFGIVMWELLTGEEPYADMHCASIIGGIVNNSLRPKIPTWCDPEWKSLMESCWASDPAERPSFSEISRKLRSMAAGMNLK